MERFRILNAALELVNIALIGLCIRIDINPITIVVILESGRSLIDMMGSAGEYTLLFASRDVGSLVQRG